MPKDILSPATAAWSQIDWHDPTQMPLSPALSAWLLDAGSLTAKLKALSPDFRVQVLHHAKAPITADEAHILKTTQHHAIVREVLLYSDEQAVVWARSILPATENPITERLNALGDQPLGEALFTHPRSTAGAIQVAKFANHSEPVKMNQQLHQTPGPLWGRRRCFMLEQTPVIVAEVFLTPAPCYQAITKESS